MGTWRGVARTAKMFQDASCCLLVLSLGGVIFGELFEPFVLVSLCVCILDQRTSVSSQGSSGAVGVVPLGRRSGRRYGH